MTVLKTRFRVNENLKTGFRVLIVSIVSILSVRVSNFYSDVCSDLATGVTFNADPLKNFYFFIVSEPRDDRFKYIKYVVQGSVDSRIQEQLSKYVDFVANKK